MKNRSKRVVVTGANRGIGLDISKSLADEGYSLVLLVRNTESVRAMNDMDFVKKSGAEIHSVDLEDVKAIADFVHSISHSVWGIVNNAGICKTHSLLDEGNDPFSEVLKTNLHAPYLLTKGLIKRMERPGRIINISSQLGVEGRQGYAAYCASKFGLIGMTKCWAKELGKFGITVNAICPGWVGTEMSHIDMNRIAKEKNMDSDEFYEKICEPLELKRFNTTGEVANLVSFLLSEKSSGITGREMLMQTIWNQE